MAEVALQNIVKVYDSAGKKGGQKVAVNDISITVQDKEFMVLVGPSGCGKSTLLRMIAGLEDISSGTLLLDGKRINDVGPRDRDIAMVFQNYALYPHMTVYDNMAFGLKLRNFKKAEIRERVMQAAKLLEIEEELFRKPNALSGGQRQRVAIGRAIVRRPKVFLFDEPLSNLDAKLRSQMRIELQKLHREINATMIYVTHDQVEAMTLGNRIAVLNKGELMQVDSPLHLYHAPANKFVATFIGTPAMNIITGSLRCEKEHYYFFDESETFRINLGNYVSEDLKNYLNQKIQAGVRPEDVLLSDNLNTPQAYLNVLAYENMGNEQLIYLTFGDSVLIARRSSSETINVGDEMAVNFVVNKIFFFDYNNGERINNSNNFL
jgi:multiple sugar transport system ATP-binding protein